MLTTTLTTAKETNSFGKFIKSGIAYLKDQELGDQIEGKEKKINLPIGTTEQMKDILVDVIEIGSSFGGMRDDDAEEEDSEEEVYSETNVFKNSV